MNPTTERRKEKRLHYELPVWFSEDMDKVAFQGALDDISSSAIAFHCSCDHNCPCVGQQLTIRFDLPSTSSSQAEGTKSFTRLGQVFRVDALGQNRYRVAVGFTEPPPFWNAPPK